MGTCNRNDTGLLLWTWYLCVGEDQAMAARVAAIRAVRRAGCSHLTLPAGGETCAPLIVASEAAVAATLGRSEDGWRRRWTEALVRAAVACQEDVTTDGVARLLALTDAIAEDLKDAGVWPWANQPQGDSPAGMGLRYADRREAGNVWGVMGTDYLVWRRVLDMMQDRDAAVRLDAVHAAEQAQCCASSRGTNENAGDLSAMVAAEGAVAARAGLSQLQWRHDWTDRLVRLAARLGDEETVEKISELLQVTSRIIERLKYARVWPWLGRPRRHRRAAEHSNHFVATR